MGVLLLSACSDKGAPKNRPPAKSPVVKASTPQHDSLLAPWLRRVPADARWAVVSADLGRLRAVLWDVTALLGHHPSLAPTLRQWRARLVRQWGGWPLAPETWARLGLRPGSGGALFRRADGATVILFRTAGLGKVVETISQAIRHRGARRVADVKRLQIAGKPAFGIAQWTCATRAGVSWCADVPPARFAQIAQPPARTLWKETLGRVPGRYLREHLGIWLSPRAGFARPLHRATATLLGWSPQGLWLATSLGRRLRLNVLALNVPQAAPKGVTPAPRPAYAARLPKPGRSGLAAAETAPLVVRLRMSPRRLGDQLGRLVPALRPALDLVRKQRDRGETLAEEMLNGEVVLLSAHAGVGAILGLRSRDRARRAMKRLMLMLGPRLAGWQKHVRGRGRGWDLSHSLSNLGDVPTHRLILQVPKNAGPGSPTLRNGRLTLLWGVAQHHLVVATDPNLFRRILARVEQPDTGYLRHLSDASGRRGFREHRAVAAFMRPDDPLYALPKAQRTAARNWLSELGPAAARWAHGIRNLLDLTDTATLSCEELHGPTAGVGCQLGVSLLTESGPGTGKKPSSAFGLPAKYRDALIKKWGGNRNGHLALLRGLAASPTATPLRAKASRVLSHRQGVPSCGVEGLLISAWIPWARHRLATAARKEAPRELDRLARALQSLASKAHVAHVRGQAHRKPATANRRWYRGLRSTRITPTRSCCKGGVRRCRSRPSDWIHPTWLRLGFALSGSHLYRYRLTLEPGALSHRIVLRALGDLDCNGRSSLLQRVGTINSATGALKLGGLIRVRADE